MHHTAVVRNMFGMFLEDLANFPVMTTRRLLRMATPDGLDVQCAAFESAMWDGLHVHCMQTQWATQALRSLFMYLHL